MAPSHRLNSFTDTVDFRDEEFLRGRPAVSVPQQMALTLLHFSERIDAETQPFGKKSIAIADTNMKPAEIKGDAQRMRKRKLLMGILLLLACIATVRVTLSLTAHGLRSAWLACALVIAEYAGGYALLSLDKMTGTIFLGTTGALFSLGTGLLSGIFGFSVLADPLKADVPMLYSLLPSFLFNLAFLFSAVRYQSAIQADVKAANFAVGCGSALIIPWFFWKYILGY